QDRDASTASEDRVLATVDGEAITEHTLARLLRPFRAEIDAIADPTAREQRRRAMRAEALDRLIDRALILREASRRQMQVTAAEVDRIVQSMASEHHASLDDVYAAVRAEGIERDEYRAFLASEVLRLRLLTQFVREHSPVTEGDIQAEYD